MRTEFIIHNGRKLIFFDNYLEISDVSKWTKRFNIINPIIWTIYSLICILRYLRTGDFFLLWSGVILLAGFTIVVVYRLRQNFDSRILFVNIDKVVIKRDFSDNLKSDFIIKSSNKKRTVLLDFDKYSLTDFELMLTNKNIKFEKE